MMENFVAFIIFWGVWLLIPVVVDGVATLYTLISVSLVHLRNMKEPIPPLEFFPLVSIIIPVYNSEETLEACLRSIANQDYPSHQMEILLINDQIRKTILTNPEADAIARIAVENGMRTLREAGLERLREGMTCIEEILRVTSEQ